MTKRGDILRTALELTEGDRNKVYGPPFINLDNTAIMWNAYIFAKYGGRPIDPLQFELTAEDVAQMNALQKMARSFAENYHEDNYIDQAAYSAIAAEVRLEGEKE